ncbi:FAD-dependent monooxygenase [Paraburkholderia gardini]|uniref:FAD-dependent monooxygenase n=1 Tax=Paraburkholderia gardini TaxID=2823469 RepID=UPI001E43900C|nr:FAD-dependent monooxygenase [Paraburkholderia gardini]
MYRGIRDTSNRIWKLAAVKQHAATTSLLDTYETERAPHARQTTLVTKRTRHADLQT